MRSFIVQGTKKQENKKVKKFEFVFFSFYASNVQECCFVKLAIIP